MTTNHYIHRRRRHALHAQQLNAIDLILAGANDRQVAERIGVHRVTVTNWRLYHPEFQIALDNRRAQLWAGGTDVIRAVLPEALETIREQLRIHPNRGRLALDLVFRAGLLGKPYAGDLATAGVGPLTMDALLDQEVLRHRAASGRPTADEDGSPLPISEEDRDAAYDRLIALANAPVPEDAPAAPMDAPAASPPAPPAPSPPAVQPAPPVQPVQPTPTIVTPTQPPAPAAAPDSPVTPVTTRRMSTFS